MVEIAARLGALKVIIGLVLPLRGFSACFSLLFGGFQMYHPRAARPYNEPVLFIDPLYFVFFLFVAARALGLVYVESAPH